MKGTAVETIGNLTGAQSWQQSGKEEHAQGEAEYKAAQAKGYAEGTIDRLGGKKDAVVGAVTGDREQEVSSEFVSVSGGCLDAMLTCRSVTQAMSAKTKARLSRS